MQRRWRGLAEGGAGWEWAAAALKAPLDAAFEALQAPEPLLALKDYVAPGLHHPRCAPLSVCAGTTAVVAGAI